MIVNNTSRLFLFCILFLSLLTQGMQPPSLRDFYAPHNVGASVLPVTTWKKSGQDVLFVILGREVFGRDKGTFDDFGGGKEHGETHPGLTASREFYEEAIANQTIGMSNQDIHKFIDADAGHTLFVVAQYNVGTNNADFVTYITEFKNTVIEQFKKNFYKARNNVHSAKNKEKDMIAIVRWDNLKDAVKKSSSSQGVKVWGAIVDPSTNAERTAEIVLRPFFVSKLRNFFYDKPYTVGKNPCIRFYQK